MRQKVVIACGLVRDATTLLFDEPLTGLDPIGIRRMRETIVARGARGRRDPGVVAPAASGGGDLHARHHHGSRQEGRRRDGRGTGLARRSGRGGLEPRADLPARHRARRRGRNRCSAPASTSSSAARRNRMRVRLRRLREPRYLIGAIVGAAYCISLLRALPRAAGARAARPRTPLAGRRDSATRSLRRTRRRGAAGHGGRRLAPAADERPARVHRG